MQRFNAKLAIRTDNRIFVQSQERMLFTFTIPKAVLQQTGTVA